MQITAAGLTIAALFASSALAQQTDRLLHFTATNSAQNFQEIATVVQAISEIPQANVDATEKSLSLQGTAGQVALAEWLFTNLDKPTSIRLDKKGAKHEYRTSDTSDDLVRVFYLTNPEVPQGVQEIVTAVRSLANIRWMFTYNDLRAAVVRGTAEQVNVAEFLFDAMDKPGIQPATPTSPEFRMNQQPDNLVRVFYLPNTKTVRDFQEVVTVVRSISDLRYAFTYNASRAVAVRGTEDRIALAKWIFENLDAASTIAARPSTNEYRFSPTSDDFVKVFYPASTSTSENVHETAARIRQTFNIRSAFGNSAPSAILIRDTAQKIALAEKLIQDQAK
ncbi:MAG: hypothetical protein ABSE86_14330 [Bryobacteraceae bacterium]|jgi:hypothetical protein